MMKFSETNIAASYRINPLAETVRKALTVPLRRYPIMLKNYMIILDDDTKDIILLFPLNDINRGNSQLRQIVLNDLQDNLKNFSLNYKEEKNNIADTYRVGFVSRVYRIKGT